MDIHKNARLTFRSRVWAGVQEKWRSARLALRQKVRVIGLCSRFADLQLCFCLRLFVSFRSNLLCHDFLELFSIHAVAFRGVHKDIVAAGGGSLICRTEQADFQ